MVQCCHGCQVLHRRYRKTEATWLRKGSSSDAHAGVAAETEVFVRSRSVRGDRGVVVDCGLSAISMNRGDTGTIVYDEQAQVDSGELMAPKRLAGATWALHRASSAEPCEEIRPSLQTVPSTVSEWP